MTGRQLVLNGLRYYWRSNLAVVAGVATAVAVMAGALLVGDSVRGSLRDLVLQRIGRTDTAVLSTAFVRESLAADLERSRTFLAEWYAAAPLIVLQGSVREAGSGRRVSQVAVYGVDDRFWHFHGVVGRTGPPRREAFVSRALAADLAAGRGATLLIRVERPSAIPIDSLQGHKEDAGRTLRVSIADVLDAAQMGDFSLRPQQGAVRAVFVPLRDLQQDLAQPGRINAMLIAGPPQAQTRLLDAALDGALTVEDRGLRVVPLPALHEIAVESASGFIDPRRAELIARAASDGGYPVRPVLTYLANSLRSGGRDVPYSLVAAIDLPTVAPAMAAAQAPGDPPIVLNDWTARDLHVEVGDPLTLDYYVWEEPGHLATKSARFRIAAVVPIAGAAADLSLAPSYPGITDASSIGDWNPPFPIDLKRVRPPDEDYWARYRTTPKAFIPYEVGSRLWGSARYGDRTSVRIGEKSSDANDAANVSTRLRLAVRPAAAGFSIVRVREQGLAASSGATDFGEYFVYFSFFLVVSALVLAALFFRLGVEQRAREVGLLRAVGLEPSRVRRLFTAEGMLLAAAGAVLGAAGAIGYAALMMKGLRSWWSGAVGTTALFLHVSAVSIAAGAAGALLAAVCCIWWVLRGLSRLSERELLAGRVSGDTALVRRASRAVPIAGALLAAAAMGLIIAASSGRVAQSEAFFGAGSALLGAGLCAIAGLLRRRPRSVEGRGWLAIVRIGWRNASQRPGRSVLAIAVIASAAFIVIAVDAFRRAPVDPSDRRSGTGGFPLIVNLDVPLVQDPNGGEGREALGLADIRGVSFVPFRLLPGEDASCLNLYQPASPRVLGAGHAFVELGRFSFQDSLASDAADRTNPWRLLEARQSDGTIPVIADANSMTYVLHKSLGDVIPLVHGDRTVRLKLVAALADSMLQGELVMAESNFTALFPEQQGYRMLLVDAAAARTSELEAAIEKDAADFGADAVPAVRRLEEFHAVENTYLSTFQTLGGLGLLVGTVGLAAVLLRNVLERRRELALLRAVGYRPSHLFRVIVAENAFLLVCGVVLGAVAAAIAVGPAAMARGARLPISAGGAWLLGGVLAAGLLSSILATRVALAAPLVGALRAE